MIRIIRSREAPRVLLIAGAEEERLLCENAGIRPSFKRQIYAHIEVRLALNTVQRSKCCYCEQIVDLDGDVEHFRPKAVYYWLAYRWDNLLLVCHRCNRAKWMHFPLEDETCRATSHEQDCAREQPLLLDPCTDSPEEHLSWDREKVIPAVSSDPRASTTIRVLKLNSEGLLKAREAHLGILAALVQITKVDEARAPLALALLAEMQSEHKPFSAMSRAYLRNLTPAAASPTE